MKPLFKWTGGKNRMSEQYAPLFFPEDSFDTFVDSFCGAGSISIWIAEQYPNCNFVFNDFNSELILLYKQLALDGEEFTRRAIVIQNKFRSYSDLNDKKKYYDELRFRHIDSKDEPMDEAVQLYCMLRINFNGFWKIYAYSKGRYASHMGVVRENIASVPDLKAWSNFLSSDRCTILNGDFEGIVPHLGKKSYIYFDPPYRDCTNIYTDEGFNEQDQIRLCALAQSLSEDGHHVGYSNSADEEFYSKHLKGFQHHYFNVNYTAGRGTSYNAASEILATNFKQRSLGLESFF